MGVSVTTHIDDLRSFVKLLRLYLESRTRMAQDIHPLDTSSDHVDPDSTSD
jgi:hypothetical protein